MEVDTMDPLLLDPTLLPRINARTFNGPTPGEFRA